MKKSRFTDQQIAFAHSQIKVDEFRDSLRAVNDLRIIEALPIR